MFTTEITSSGRDILAALRDCCISEKDYINLIWSMRVAASTPVPRSHRRAWPFLRAGMGVVIPASVLRRRRKNRRQKPRELL